MNEHIDTHALKAISAVQRPGKPDWLTRVIHLHYTACIVLGDGLAEMFDQCCAELSPYLANAA